MEQEPGARSCSLNLPAGLTRWPSCATHARDDRAGPLAARARSVTLATAAAAVAAYVFAGAGRARGSLIAGAQRGDLIARSDRPVPRLILIAALATVELIAHADVPFHGVKTAAIV
jgi:hypothetical protein